MATEIEKTDAQWREELTPEQYAVLRQAGTERAFSGKYWDNHEDGMFRCAGCGAELWADPGDCCVFCTYGSVPCPAVQQQRGERPTPPHSGDRCA